jgi:ABC-2 type transport system ATP-binding protein
VHRSSAFRAALIAPTTLAALATPAMPAMPLTAPSMSTLPTTPITIPAADAAIRFDHVGLRHGAVDALKGVSLAVRRGSLCALCGPNGAGKSSALRIVCGLARPSAGSGEVLGEALSARPARRRAQIGYMAQHTVLYDELTVVENLRFRAAVMGLARASQRAEEALHEHQLDDVRSQRVGHLSGGWRQRVAFCAARLARPRLLLLDEPTAGLDADARSTLWVELRAAAAAGVTVLVSTHDAAEAALCDTLVVLDAGRVAFAGAPAQHWSAHELDALRAAAAIGMKPR